MNQPDLHIVSFDIPDPPNYGGVIDVFYKIRALVNKGVKIHLHCFQYDGKQESKLLNDLCFKVDYYPRKTLWRKAIGTTPYIIASRFNESLIKNLANNQVPILFEGMHTAGNGLHPNLKERHKALRMHNLEWEYYGQLAKEEKNLIKKLYYKTESRRLLNYRHILEKMDLIFSISESEQSILESNYQQSKYLPVFHKHHSVDIKEGVGEYILYHGNLDVSENKKAVDFIIYEIGLKELPLPLIIAGKCQKGNPLLNSNQRFKLIPNPTEIQMDDLISNAQIHLIPTFQSTGIKLKLINALYNGRHVLTNNQMLDGTGLNLECNIANSADEFKAQLKELSDKEVSPNEVVSRTKKLNGLFFK